MNEYSRAEAFPDGFEAAFSVGENNALLHSDCTREWYNSHLDFLFMLLGFRPRELRSLEIDELNRAYAFAYVVYRKMCNMYLRRTMRDSDMVFVSQGV